MMSDRPIVSLAGFAPRRRLRCIFAAAVLAAAAALNPAEAAVRSRFVGSDTYDGIWNVVFATRAGSCSSTNSVPFAVSRGRVSSAGGGRVTGGVVRGGYVAVTVSIGASVASGTGRLAGSYGGGRWSGIIQGDRCSGTWQAMRG
jgi:hypothetical protein